MFLNISHKPAKLAVDRPCGTGDIVYLFCHVISRDHVITVCL